jgi:hypothetical protein
MCKIQIIMHRNELLASLVIIVLITVEKPGIYCNIIDQIDKASLVLDTIK